MALQKMRYLFAIVMLIYVVSPVIFRHSPLIQRSLLFMNNFNTHYKSNLSHPELSGIKCSRTLRLARGQASNGVGNEEQDQLIELGVWHIPPESSLSSCVTEHQTNRTSIEDAIAFADSRPIILYVHGNGGNRAGDHRARIYRRLAYEHDFHVVTFDYRGYGDSTNLQPTADGLTSDATFMYNWLLKQKNVDKGRIIVWGHSLGTAVATRMVASLPDSREPKQLILEAPFDTVGNAVANHPFSTPFRIIPYFDYFFIEPIVKSPELNFDSSNRIGDIKSTKVLILHAEDDGIIPFKLGYSLYKRAVETLGKSRVELIKISANEGLGHKHICNHDETMTLVKKFIDEK